MDDYTELLKLLRELDEAADSLKMCARSAIGTVEQAQQTWSKDSAAMKQSIPYTLNSIAMAITRCANRRAAIEAERDKRL